MEEAEKKNVFHQQEIWRELLTQRKKSTEKITPNFFIFYLRSKRIADDRKIDLLKHIEPATKKYDKVPGIGRDRPRWN
jgi:phenylalanine-4-hydroxylase